jgi:predicted ribosomally synthesized peptide with SipW-like signal peptide
MFRKSRKLAGILAGLGLGVGLLGTGVFASFTDSATATDNIAVGTFGITVSSTTPGATVVNTGNGQHSVTFTAPAIQSSVAGQTALDFKVADTGSMPATITVASNGGMPLFAAPWADLLSNPGAEQLSPSPISGSQINSYDYTGGIQWGALSNSDLGSSHSVTYTVSATG